MGRSIKKGPFVEAKLIAKINAMNEKNEKSLLKHGQEHLQYSLKWLVIQLQFTTEESMFRYM